MMNKCKYNHTIETKDMNSRITFISIALGLLCVSVVVLMYVNIEGFGSTQPGTLVQLAAGRAPTETDDLDEEAKEYSELIKRDLVDMTGSYP
jgi:hypothetical protein